MFQYLFFMLYRQKSRSTLASGGFLLAACALILLSATTQTTVLQAHQIINKNWRSTYDLVVLPSYTNVPTGQAVPADVLEGYDGGISMQQYQQIKRLPGIAVAAPIAFMGYVPFPAFNVQYGPSHLAPGFYQEKWTLSAFNGIQQLPEYRFSAMIYVGSLPVPFDDKTQHLFDTLNIQGYWDIHAGQYQSALPDGVLGTFMLAAIDPNAENQLLHLDQSIVKGRMLSENDTISLDSYQPQYQSSLTGTIAPNYDVPLLLNTHLPEQATLHVSFTRLITDVTTLNLAQGRGGERYLQHLPQQTIFEGDVPFSPTDPQLLAQGVTFIQSGHAWHIQHDPTMPTSYPLDFVATPSGLTYQSASTSPGNTSSAYRLVPSSDQNPVDYNVSQKQYLGKYFSNTKHIDSEVAFRTLSPLPVNTDQSGIVHLYNGAMYSTQPVGQFDGTRLAAEFTNALNWLPENTYASPPAVLRYDAQGHPVKPTPLLPTTNPAGYLLQPPLALTTLKAAQQIVGNRLISVIRVRISGNVTPDETGWKHVAQVAQEIHQRTGLQIFVTLGSSPAPTLVYIPGLKKGQDGSTKDIPPVGWVQERWIAIGAGIVYLNQLGETQTLLLGAVLLVCLGYLVVTMSSLVSAQRRELAVLSALGWRPWHPASMFLAQALALSLCGGVVGIGLALLMVALIGASPPWQIVAWTMPGVLGLALLSAFYPLWTIWRIQPAEVLRAGTMVTKESTTSRLNRWNAAFWSRLPAVGGMALRNLTRSRLRAVIAIGSLFLSAVLLTVMVDGILAFRQTLQGTLLGDYVLLQTAVPQIAGAVFAIILTFLSVADLLLLQVRERQKEIGLLQAVGWRAKIVQRLFVQEGLMLAVVGAVPGVLLALGVLMTQHAAPGAIPAPLVGLGAIVLMLIVAGLATIPAVRAVNRLPMMDVLRAD